LSDAADPLLVVDDLSAGYGDIRATWSVTLSVHAGRITAVLGRNGAGKTTTLLAVAGVLRARTGSIRLEGREISSTSADARTRLGISLVQENKRIFRQRTVEQNMMLGAYCLPRRDRKASVEAAYERFPLLNERRGARAGALSGGQQQMLAIAQALASRPKVLMIDEPSGGLAPVVVHAVMETVRQLAADGIGILLVEQLVDQALDIADWAIVLDNGRVALSGATGTLGGSAQLRDVYLGVGAPTAAEKERTTP
jgi:branched-chain amino acid transport system ATP-binding protein